MADGKRKILVVTGNRADWGPLSFVANAIRDTPGFHIAVAATGQHLEGYLPGAQITLEGWDVQVATFFHGTKRTDDALGVTSEFGCTTMAAGSLYKTMQPDLVLVLGDRFEILAAVIAACIARIPVAHIAGGDVSEGSLDDGFRNAITALAHLHFTSHAHAADRVRKMLCYSCDDRVWATGSPAVDRVLATPLLKNAELRERLQLGGDPIVTVNFQPPTLSPDPLGELDEMFAALQQIWDGATFAIIGCNNDEFGRAIEARLQEFAISAPSARFFAHLPSQVYLSLLRQSRCLVGNSSSGYYDAPALGCAVVDIGDRQSGRVRSPCILRAGANAREIYEILRLQFTHGRFQPATTNGDGTASKQIAAILASIDPSKLIQKGQPCHSTNNGTPSTPPGAGENTQTSI